MSLARAFIVAAALAVSGCSTVGYYAQAAGGQLDLLARARPIGDILADRPSNDALVPEPPATPELKQRLRSVLDIREFASRELALPDNDSYRRFVALDRPAVAWNVFANPEFSLVPKTWCFLVAGCVPYRGYFVRERAERFALELRREGLDVQVAPVMAYSTLGWFHDPLLSTHLRYHDADLAALLFHELAHQVLYVPGDAEFNESFATAVEIEGLRRWLAARGDSAALAAQRSARARRAEFVRLVLRFRDELAALYRSPLPADTLRAEKARRLETLLDAYGRERGRWPAGENYDGWFAQDLNNAHLASIGLYHRHVPAFETLLASVNGDLPAFYRAAGALARLPAMERAARLRALVETRVTQVE